MADELFEDLKVPETLSEALQGASIAVAEQAIASFFRVLNVCKGSGERKQGWAAQLVLSWIRSEEFVKERDRMSSAPINRGQVSGYAGPSTEGESQAAKEETAQDEPDSPGHFRAVRSMARGRSQGDVPKPGCAVLDAYRTLVAESARVEGRGEAWRAVLPEADECQAGYG